MQKKYFELPNPVGGKITDLETKFWPGLSAVWGIAADAEEERN